MRYVLDRLKEPSTYAGLAALAAAFGVHVDGQVLQASFGVATAAAGLASVLIKEKGESW
ncbi:hypothetical protein PbB2_00107 [Candidatus Phycosocius bacilliformis]|uniref:Uncharacterized protein n=1 Tax=Candidatus Phycosocius bacilliformis TaxID=1445552 RepID=A0A2P2E5W0_9PROT|nr:hypothetical protein [Candidatus Phycosocius bacilliformis]GBF56451.1 hypothetical protein PbB2_00107 [Candidatus Phycosocius bacilliformis]